MTAADTTTAAGTGGGTGPAVTVEQMDVTYKVRGQDRLALRDISFQIGRNESYGLVGSRDPASPRWRWHSPGTCRATAG